MLSRLQLDIATSGEPNRFVVEIQPDDSSVGSAEHLRSYQMFDTIGAVGGTAAYALLVGVLVGLSQMSGAAKFAAFATAVVWGIIVVAVAALGGFAQGAAGPVPVPPLAFVCFLAVLFGSWFALPKFRNAVLSVPLPALVAVNAARLGGVFFLILTNESRLSKPFGPAAGWGDIVVGALAIPLATVAVDGAVKYRTGLRLWNWLGALDLVNAVTLGLLSAPGTPFRVFTEGPGTSAMADLPWVMVPAMLVPLYFLIHFTIAKKLRELQRSIPHVVSLRGVA
jgi:hypothetical protein